MKLAGDGPESLCMTISLRRRDDMKLRCVLLATWFLLFNTPLHAQWLKEPTRGIPRTVDGTPDLAAPAPRTPEGRPDFTGLWLAPFHPGYIINLAADLQPADVQPWAAQAFDQHINELGKEDPGTIGCQPLGPRHITGGGLVRRAKIVQSPALILVLYEDLNYRQIFMDGRTLERNPSASFMGYSVGRWEGDELVVESNGFKDTTWLDFGGHPHSEDLRIIERYRRTDFGHVRRQITLTDPKAFKKPITVASDMTLEPDTELLEYVCAETPRERFGLVGRTEAEEQVRVAPEILEKYVGDYDFKSSNVFGIQVATVRRSGDQLFIDFNGKGRTPLVPLSQTMFSPRLLGTYEFVADDHGTTTHVLVHGVEGTEKAMRRQQPGKKE
jgi:hypothetical protein